MKNARSALLRKWRFKLLRAYTERWDQYARELARHSVRQARLKRYFPWLGIGAPVLCAGGGGLALAGYYWGALFMAGAIFAGLLAAILWAYLSWKPRRPENPLEQSSKNKHISPLKEKLFPELMLLWWQGMAAEIPDAQTVERMANGPEKMYGLIGEFALVRELNRIVTPGTLILHSLMPVHGDDMDVVVIGPKGFWYFEVKYWNAHFGWQAGAWDIQKTDHSTGQKTRINMKQYPDKQWLRMQEETLRTLDLKGRDLLKEAPAVGDIMGGIVFAHPEATYDIQQNASFAWGATRWWIDEYKRAPSLEEMTPEVILKLAEILLKRHQDLNPGESVVSLKAHAARVLYNVEGDIRAWIHVTRRQDSMDEN